MITSANRFLPVALASMLLVTGASNARAAASGWEQDGDASWYGEFHQGRRTSSGEIFDQNRLTAAHSTLPLGTRVRVTRQSTGESVVVTINDRLPPKRTRVIDLSRGAASRIGLLNDGVGRVRLVMANSN